MRWVTMAWWRGDVPRSTAEGYTAHFESIRHRLPESLRDFHQTVTLHDAKLLRLEVDLEAQRARFEYDGYLWRPDVMPDQPCRWVLHYEGVRSIRSAAEPAGGLPGPDGFGDYGYDELDVTPDGLVEHRMLFSSSIQLTITFRKLAVERTDAPA
jgi:hypothetical protein